MNCQKCQSELKLIPAGVSKKTGRPYQPFYTCPNGCQQPKGQIPPQHGFSQQHANNLMAKENKAIEEKKWEDISRGKVRHGFALEAFKMGMPLDNGSVKTIDKWVEYVMTGKLYTFSKEEEIPTIDQELPVDFPSF